MNKQQILVIAATACLMAGTSAYANGCRSAAAAAQGGQNGHTVDVEAADQVQQNNKTSSDALGQCVAAVVNLPTLSSFPSLSAIFDNVRNQICTAISNEVNGVIQSVIPPIPTFPTIPPVPIIPHAHALSISPTANAVPVSTQSEPAAVPASADFWRHIWR